MLEYRAILRLMEGVLLNDDGKNKKQSKAKRKIVIKLYSL